MLEDRIGVGASGSVWRARRTGSVSQVAAVKRLHADADADRERLRREAGVLLGLDHPHLVRVLDVVDDGDGVALVLQYAPGGSLADLLIERRQLRPSDVVGVAAPIADALASAHRRGVVHGDVKPANVLFTSDGEPLLADFGIARMVGRAVTSEHRVSGTAEYLAPELLDGEVPSAASDVYALGVTCYEALTGAPPYAGATPLAVVRAADTGRHTPLVEAAPGTPQALADVVEAAFARDPADRPRSADELARALRSAVGGEPTLPGLPTTAGVAAPDRPGTRVFGPRPPRPERATSTTTSRRRAAVVVSGVVLVLAAVAVALLLVTGDDADEPATLPACEGDEPEAPAGAQVATGDVAGIGCATTVVYADEGGSMVLTVRLHPDDADVARYGVGRAGDRLLLGDWECDGIDTPALYRPSTGEVLTFGSWAPPGTEVRPSSTDNLTPGGEPSVDRSGGPDGCDRVVVAAER